MGIDAKGGAGDQRAIVLTLGDSEERGIVRQDGMDGIHLISKGFVQYLQVEHIAQLQFVQIGKHLLCGHTGMPRQDGVRTFAADRQRTAKKMANANVQSF